MSKYVIDTTLDNVKKVIAMGVTKGGAIWTDTTDIENLEELNSDYINEHFGSLQDEAYQAGMDKAWEATKKIFGYEIDGAIPIADIGNVFGYEPCKAFCTADILRDFTAPEAIAKLKAYEENQKADDKIEVGDEVIYNGTTKCLVVRPETDERYAVLIDSNGNQHHADHSECKKTGRHFDIASILEEMRND